MNAKSVKIIWSILLSALIIRFITLGFYPLMDTTEARYGEMARIMVETGNWLTPQFDYNVPFWGKPPLFTWMSSLGIELFGVNEFAVRFPHWLAGVIIILIVAQFASRHKIDSLLTSLVIATCTVFSVSAGAVMTDMALTLAMTLAMVGFYQCWHGAKNAGLIGFLGLALGLLAKGPLIIVLVGLSIFPWIIFNYGVKNGIVIFFRKVPFIKGLGILAAVALPWYLMAEAATPGFLNYFIVGEHFQRFVVSGWQGDLYGSAHQEPKGMIWLFWLYAAAPWSIALPLMVWFSRKNKKEETKVNSDLKSYLLFWMISPMLLFTLAGNVLPAYVLPGIPALGMLVALYVSPKNIKWIYGCASIVPVLLIIVLFVLQSGIADRKSDKYIMQHADLSKPIYYALKKTFSGQFYSSGKANVLKDVTPANLPNDPFQLVGTKSQIDKWVNNKKLECQSQFISKENRRSLYQCWRPMK